jgi:biofilm PGA synthesis N-glycosyltransferase PgaC
MDIIIEFLGSLLEGMSNGMLNVFDNIEACFMRNLDWHSVMRTYWYLFFIEFPRYYLLEIIIVLWYKLNWQSRKRNNTVARMLLFSENPLVSIIIPGKNEGVHFFKLVKSLQEQTYKNFEVIVISDGSDDLTSLMGEDLLRSGYIDHFIHMKKRGGKASAANMGLNMVKGKYVVHLDADSSLDRDAIEKILIPFYLNPKVKGVGGCVKVRNTYDTICTSLQTLEYLKTIMVGRLVTSALGIYHIISGAFGAFDTETLRSVGGWDIGPGLDGDVTQKLRKAGHKVVFVHDAVCLTNVPTKWHKLFKQRIRWSRSLVRFRIRKHRDIFFPNRNFNWSNWISNMENLIYDCLFNYLWLIYIITLCFNHTDRLLEVLLIGWLIRWIFGYVAFIVIMMVTGRRREEFWLFAYVPLSTFYTGYFLRLTRLIGHTTEFFFFRSYKDKWNPHKTSIIAQIEKQ